jgi:predicted phosphate transport protein (TIGR00153 family)
MGQPVHGRHRAVASPRHIGHRRIHQGGFQEACVLDWFRRLIPQSGDFFTLFERHSAACVAAAEALARLIGGEGDSGKLCAEIRDREHEADEIIRTVLNEVRQTFLTPFDRGAIIGLIGAMDDTIDEIHACASAIELYDFSDFEPEMNEMAEKVLGATRMIDKGLPLLRDVARNGDALHELTAQVVAVEGEVDSIPDRALKNNFARARETGDTLRFLVGREIYKHLERIADEFEDVANQIDGIVVDHA